MRNHKEILVGKPKGKKPLGISRSRPEDNIKMDHPERGYGVVDWIHLALNRIQWSFFFVNTVKKVDS
jgi:hypothetical protein